MQQFTNDECKNNRMIYWNTKTLEEHTLEQWNRNALWHRCSRFKGGEVNVKKNEEKTEGEENYKGKRQNDIDIPSWWQMQVGMWGSLGCANIGCYITLHTCMNW